MSGDDAESDVDGDLTTENGSESRNKAAIWLHFVQLPNSQSKCNYCQTILKNLYGNTTCLQRHMCSKHPAEYKKYKIQDAKNKTERAASKRKSSSSTNPGNTCSSAKQTKISDCFKVKQPLPASHPAAKQMTRAIGEWIAINLQPYSVVEERGFVKVMKLAMPEYNIPSRTTFSRSVIPELFKEQMEKVKTKLEEMKSQATSLALTTDLWSSRANDSYISLTGHFMSPSFEIISICMGNSIFPGSHTSEAILNKLMAMVNVWNLGDVTETLPVYVVTDNARNLKVAINRSLWTPMQCFAHTLQLVIHDAKKEDAIPDVIRKARTIVSHYNQSPKAESNLHEQQSRHKLPQQNLPQDVPTRWNSEFYMLHRLVGNKAAIISEYNDSDDTGRMDMLTRADWKLAEGIVKILKPFADATEEISGEKYPTLSLVIPIIFQLEKSLLRFIGNADQGSGIGFARVMLRNLKARFPLYMDDYERCTAMVLDPRFKNILLNEVRKNSVQRWLLAEMLQVNGDLHAHATPEDVAVPNLAQPSTSTASDDSLWGSFDSQPIEDVPEDDAASLELRYYLSQSTIPRLADPLAWWRANREKFPLLANVARKLLSVPATQTASERQFSTAGNTITCRRENLLPRHVEQIVFLNKTL